MAGNKILVAGGAGYIGSFVVLDLYKSGFEPIVVDDLSSGHLKAISDFKFYKVNILEDKEGLFNVFKKEKPEGVIHLAGFIQMGESYRDPLLYFRTNLGISQNLFEAMNIFGVNKIVFSSSAGVYGNPSNVPIKEEDPKNPLNPYGETKLMIEKMLYWLDKTLGFRYVALRYFNAAGASFDGNIGEDHPNESHIIPLIIKSVLQKKEFVIFGDDYKTRDGTCERDYVHVLDLAKAHTKALEFLFQGGESDCFNVGCNKGVTNKELIKILEEIVGVNIDYKIGPRRPGDADALWASNEKIKQKLNWKPSYEIRDILKSAYLWHSKNPKGYL
jgi:UDP-glucose 4-epimerase